MSRMTAKQRIGIYVTVVFFLAAVLIVWTVRPKGLHPDSVRWEVMSAAVQGLTAAAIGFFVGQAAFDLQQERFGKEQYRDRLRSLLEETTTSYNSVKFVRRVLEAEAGPEPEAASLSSEAYARSMTRLCEAQLGFESLRRRAPLFQERMTDARMIATGSSEDASLENHYKAIENYLNCVIEEFQKKFKLIPAGEERSFTALGLTALPLFVYDTDDFKSEVAIRIEAVIRLLERDLLPVK